MAILTDASRLLSSISAVIMIALVNANPWIGGRAFGAR